MLSVFPRLTATLVKANSAHCTSQFHIMSTFPAIRLAIQNGQTRVALERLVAYVADRLPDQKDLQDSTITLLARFNQLERNRHEGNISDGESQISENQIVYNTLEVLKILSRELDSSSLNTSTEEDSHTPKTKILFFAANPLGAGQLNLDREIRSIEGALSRAKLRDRFSLRKASATRPKDFLRSILEFQPEIVHFSGHGTTSGIYMLDEDDDTIIVPKDKLAEAFKLFREVIGCVVLNACFSAVQAEKIYEYVPNVIGTTQAVGDDTAIQFSSHFYTALGEGRDIAFAYEFAKVGLGLESLAAQQFQFC